MVYPSPITTACAACIFVFFSLSFTANSTIKPPNQPNIYANIALVFDS